MAAPRTMSGARAIVRIAGPGGVSPAAVGIFSDFSYAMNLDVQPVNLLGRYSPAETVYTGAEPVRCNGTGWKVVGAGPHASVKFPHIQDLLQHEYIQIDVVDRQTGKRVAVIRDVRPESYSTTVSARQLVQTNHSFIGLLVDDDADTEVANAEGGDVGTKPNTLP
jgi:hypothetical protein